MTRAELLDLRVLPQPDDTTCGPTCLHAVYKYWGVEVPLGSVLSVIPALPTGGTLAVSLAADALRRGFRSQIFTYNLQLFDPTWFSEGVDLAAKLRAQRGFKSGEKLGLATDAYLEFLELGGELCFEPLTTELLCRFLDHDVPILTGLSATYLYACAREYGNEFDDVRGAPTGHFVVLKGYEETTGEVLVADPLLDNPLTGSHYYRVSAESLIAAIFLGILTYDANLLVVTPTKGHP